MSSRILDGSGSLELVDLLVLDGSGSPELLDLVVLDGNSSQEMTLGRQDDGLEASYSQGTSTDRTFLRTC